MEITLFTHETYRVDRTGGCLYRCTTATALPVQPVFAPALLTLEGG